MFRMHELLPGKLTSKKRKTLNRRGRATHRRTSHEPLEDRYLLTSYSVETTVDDPGDGLVGLREAIEAANTNDASGDAPAGEAGPGVVDSITFAATLSGQTIELDGMELVIADNLTISDGNAVPVTIDAEGTSRGFNIDTGADTVSISDITITGGSATQGGGILVAADQELSLTDVTITDNEATGTASTDGGGGIYNNGGTLIITGDSTISNNTAEGSGGGILNAGGELSVEGGSITGNSAVTGGGVHNLAEPDPTEFSLNFTALNGSGVSGTGSVTITSPTSTTREITVEIDAEGLQDLSGIDGAIHVSHIHGQFAGNASRPLLQQGDGPFFDGEGGTANGFAPVDSVLPSVADDDGLTIEDGFLDFLEGRPDYGPVILNLTSTQLRDASPNGSNPPDGVPPLTHFLNLAGNGDIMPGNLFPNGTEFNLNTTYTFDLTNADEERQFNNLSPLGQREVVIHGQTIDTETSEAIDEAAMGTAPAGVDLGNGMSFRVTAPVAAAEIRAVGGSSTLTDVSISNNTATGDAANQGGGGIFNAGGSLSIEGGSIAGNFALGDSGSGGGIFNGPGGTVEVTGTAIQANVANRAGGGIEDASDSSQGIRLTNVNLDSNVAGVTPSATSASPGNGGGLHVSGSAGVSITGGTVSGNLAAAEGGGLWNGSGTLTVNGTTISGNTASGDEADQGGGGVFNAGGTVEITDATISSNVVDGTEGAGGGILNDGGQLTVNDGMISSNSAVTGGGVHSITAEDPTEFSLNFTALNGSQVTGVGTVTVTSPTADTREIRVQIDAEGLEDLSGIDGAIHVSHIHGQFAGNADRPLLEQGDGPFFDGAGGAANSFPPVDSVLPTLASDDGKTIEDGFLDFLEGRPDYGPVILNLTSTQLRDASPNGSNPPDGTPPLTHFLNLAGSGDIMPGNLFPNGTEFNLDTTYTFDLTNADEERQFNNLSPLGQREVVIHGQTIDTDISEAIDAAAMGTAPAGVDLGNGMSFRVTAPVAAAEIVADGGSTTLNNVSITDNTASGDAATQGGGGVYNQGGSLTINGGLISNNSALGASGSGGGIFNAEGGTVVATDTEIEDNRASRAGGGIEDASNSPQAIRLTNVTLDLNNAGSGSLITPNPGNGGGLHVSGSGGISITGGTVSGNAAAAEGGGLWNGSGTMELDGTTINGNTASGNDSDQGGGGVYNLNGTLDIQNATISNNEADGDAGSGGGILNDAGGTLTVTDSSITGNIAARAGGGIEDNSGAGVGITLTNVSLDENNAGVQPDAAATAPGNGGGLHVSGAGDVNVTDGTVNGNVAAAEGGGLWIGTGTLSIDGTTIDGNTASGVESDQGGGGVFNSGGTVNIINATISNNDADGDAGSGGGILNDGGVLTIESTTIDSNTSVRAGGGIEDNARVGQTSVTLTDTTLSNNSTGDSPGNGGGLHISGPGTVSLTGGAVTGNTAGSEGGGLWNSSNGMLTVTEVTVDGNTANGNAADNGGGGIFSDGGTTNIARSTISNNTAAGTNANGGGLHVAGGTTSITNSTIANNEATGGSGGGVAIAGGTVNHVNVTIAYNTAAVSGGGVANLGGTANVQNTIVAENTAPTGTDVSGAISSGDNNLIGVTAGATITGSVANSFVDVSAQLGTLQDNGGPTLTILPQAGSPAIDAGVDAGLTVDQRGVTRPQFGLFDIGAVEIQAGDLQDAAVDGEGNLVVNGGGRIIVYTSNGFVFVRINNEISGPFDVTGRIIVNGSAGQDFIVLAGSLDRGADIFGGDGNDYIAGNAGDDSLFGGDGNDILFGSAGDNYLEGGSGNDRLEAREGMDTMLGGDGNDRLNAQFGNDTLDGGAGNDFISGGGDDDIIRGGDDNDVITGYTGNDIVLGGNGSDQLFGRQGNDIVIGGEGSDRVRTNSGSDVVIGNSSNLDDDDQALQAVLAELVAGGGFDNIQNGTGGVPQLTSVEDNAVDELIGDTEPDLYYSTFDDFIRNLRTEDVVVN